jgi:hypothetical protein
MAIDVVHRLIGVIDVIAAVRKQIITAINTTHQVRNQARIASDEAPDVVAIARVPLQPRGARKTTAELICSGVPGLCDQRQPA